MLRLFWGFVRKLETRARECDQAGFYKHLKTMNLERKRDRSLAYVKFHTLLNVKLPKLDPNIAEGLDQWPENMSPEVQPTIQELAGAIRSLANGKAVAPDGVYV